MDPTRLVVSFLPQVPLVLLFTVGIVLAIIRWQRHPLASLLLVVGATIELLLAVAYTVLPYALENNGSMMAAFSVLRLVGLVGTALVMAAVFVERPLSATPQR